MDSINQSLHSGTILKGKAYEYKIERALGQGAFGITYLASTKVKGPLGEIMVQVALKEFFAKDLDLRLEDGTVTARTEDGIAHRYARAFQRESENLSRMKHPCIVNVLEAFAAKGTYYYSMEYLSGGCLDDKIKEDGIPEDEALGLIKSISDALSYMHDRRMMHLDLKPKNIMLKEDGTPVIIDFGLSKQYDSSGEPESSSSIGLGTPGYAPLEQATQTSNHEFQPTLDIYALGATLYKMLAGVTPPQATMILNKGFADSALEQKDVTPSTISAIRKAMSPLVESRPQTVSDFLKLLNNNTAEGEDETFRKPSIEERNEPPAQKGEKEPRIKNYMSILFVVCILVVVVTVIFIIVGHSDIKGGSKKPEVVDLGLSVKWRNRNLGASTPEGYGDYYAWGETSTKSNYNWSTYKYCNGDYHTVTKYCTNSSYGYNGFTDNKTVLDLSDDAAREKLGGSWRMPTDEEWTELRTSCTWTWTTQNGVNGYKVTSKTNGNSIFLPAAGFRVDAGLYDVGSYGYFWSSSLTTGDPTNAWYVGFGSSYVSRTNFVDRSFGQSVRPVLE